MALKNVYTIEKNMRTNSAGQGMKVLVAEDDIESQHLLKTYLEILGCHVDTAQNGMGAIDKFINREYGICFMDLGMPLMGGLEAARIIREEQNEMPIIAMTENVTDEDFEIVVVSG